MTDFVCLSPHLEFPANTRYAYHALFGNLCQIDDELRQYLQRLDQPFSFQQLAAQTSNEIAYELLQNYFVVRSSNEERELIEGWLREREALLPSGFFLEALQISTSNLCNFACSYCFADVADKRSARRQTISSFQPTLTFQTAVQAIDALLENAKKHGRENIGAKFLGREPLVNWQTIQQLLDYYRDTPIQWSMTSNGSLITETIAEQLRVYNVSVVISLDGPPQTNNALRILKTAGSSFHQSERGIRRLREGGVPFGISSVISRATNFETFFPFVEQMAEYGARELELTLVMQTNELEAQYHPEGTKTLLDFLVQIYLHANKLGLLVHGDWIDPFHRILSTHKRRDEQYIARNLPAGCSATSHQISLESNGDLFPCRAMSLHYGHINNLQAALEGAAYRSVGMRTFFNVPYCRGCKLEGFCQGTCLGSCEENDGDIYNPQETYCQIYREATERLFLTYKGGATDGD